MLYLMCQGKDLYEIKRRLKKLYKGGTINFYIIQATINLSQRRIIWNLMNY